MAVSILWWVIAKHVIARHAIARHTIARHANDIYDNNDISVMNYISDATQPKNGGISVTGTPIIALKNIWRVLTYAVVHTEFELSIKFCG